MGKIDFSETITESRYENMKWGERNGPKKRGDNAHPWNRKTGYKILQLIVEIIMEETEVRGGGKKK